MVSTGLIAIDATILATAVPSIVREVGGFSSFPWLFSVYLLAQAVSVPVYAKLADTVGRKPIMLLRDRGVPASASVLCGLAWSMPALIAFRALQGLGAGAVQPMAITIAGDIYTRRRARHRAGLHRQRLGRLLGGRTDPRRALRPAAACGAGSSSSTCPLCLLAGVLIWRNFHENVERRPHRIDYAGAVLLTSAMTLLILGVLEGGQAWAWSSPTSIAVFAVRHGPAGRLRVRGATRRRADAAAVGAQPAAVADHEPSLALGVGVILIGLTSYVPTYLEDALGRAPLVARARAGRADARLAAVGQPSPAGCSTCGSGSGRRS